MKALAWHGQGSMRCDTVPDTKIEHPGDAIIKVTACAICGSDLHLYDGIIQLMQHGDVLDRNPSTRCRHRSLIRNQLRTGKMAC